MNSDIKNAVMSTILLIVCIIISLHLNTEPNVSDTLKNTLSFMGGQYLMSSFTKIPITRFISSIKPFTSIISGGEFKKIIDYVENTDLKNIDEKYRLSIEKYVNMLLEHRSKKLRDVYSFGFEFKEIMDLVEILTVMGSNDNVIEKNDIRQYVKSIDNILVTYENKQELKDFIFKPILGNFYMTQKKRIPICPIYLCGEPGVGKTRFVNLLSEKLDIPIKILEEEDTNVIGYYSKIISSHTISFKRENMSPITNIIYEWKNNGKIMGIIFVDELDKMISKEVENSHKYSKIGRFLLKILGTGNTHLRDPYIDIDIDVSNMLVICTGNKKLSEISDDFKPLEERFITINFPSVNMETKIIIALKYANECLFRDLSKEERIAVISITKEDTHSGVRILKQNVEIYVRKIQFDDLFKDTTWKKNKKVIT
jgi:ATP-dependent Lon protease